MSALLNFLNYVGLVACFLAAAYLLLLISQSFPRQLVQPDIVFFSITTLVTLTITASTRTFYHMLWLLPCTVYAPRWINAKYVADNPRYAYRLPQAPLPKEQPKATDEQCLPPANQKEQQTSEDITHTYIKVLYWAHDFNGDRCGLASHSIPAKFLGNVESIDYSIERARFRLAGDRTCTAVIRRTTSGPFKECEL